MSKNIFSIAHPSAKVKYKSKEYISRVCCDVIEDILKSAYHEENPLTTVLQRCSQGTQTEKEVHYNYVTVRQKIFESLIVTMVEIRKLRFRKFPNINQSAEPNDNNVRLFPDNDNDSDDADDVYEIVENDFRFREFELERRYSLISSGLSRSYAAGGEGGGSGFETLEKLQETLIQISLTLGQFVNDRLGFMERNIFRINNGAPPEVPNLQNVPLDMRMVAFLLAQGDNRNVEELLRTVHQNIVVNVNMSYYFKIMLVMLTFNTLLLFKWILWDQWPFFW